MSRCTCLTSRASTASVDIPARQVRIDYDEAHVNTEKMKEIPNAEDYPVESVS